MGVGISIKTNCYLMENIAVLGLGNIGMHVAKSIQALG